MIHLPCNVPSAHIYEAGPHHILLSRLDRAWLSILRKKDGSTAVYRRPDHWSRDNPLLLYPTPFDLLEREDLVKIIEAAS